MQETVPKVSAEDINFANINHIEAKGAAMILADLGWALGGESNPEEIWDVLIGVYSQEKETMYLDVVNDDGFIQIANHDITAIYITENSQLVAKCLTVDGENYWILIEE